MATGSQMPGESIGAAVRFVGSGVEPRVGDVVLRPVGRVASGEVAFPFAERRYAESFLAERERVALQDGLGAMRGFVVVLGLYGVMAALGLGGLMLWHWLM